MKKLSVIISTLLLISCSGNTPPESYMNKKLAVIFSNNGVPYVSDKSLSDFLSISKTGKWEKVSNEQWIYRVSGYDPLTKQENNISYLFIKSKIKNQESIILDRVLINDQNATGYEKDTIFNQIISSKK